MDLFCKTTAVVLISAILVLSLDRMSKDFSILLIFTIVVGISLSGASMLQPVMDYLKDLEHLSGISSTMLLCLLKIFGVGIAGEISASVCADAGNAALGKGLHFLTNSAIAYLSIPVFSSVSSLILQLMNGL